jgi:O-antigen ligase
MTAASYDHPGWHAKASPRTERLAFGLGVLMVLIYSQAAVAPLSGESSNPEASSLIRALYYPAYAATLILAAGAWRRTLKALMRAPLLIVLVTLAAVSVIWSVDQDSTLRRSVALAFTCLSGVVLAARFGWARLAEVFACGFAILAVASIFTGLALPHIGRMSDIFPGAWRGLWFEKNGLGENMALGFCACAAAAALNPARRRLWLGAAALALVLVLLSTSKTSLVALMLGALVIGFVWLARRGPVAGVAAAWIGVAALIVAFALVLFMPDAVFAVLGKDETLTGRTRIWSAVLRQIHTRPWLGYGYGSVWFDTDIWAPLAKIIKDAGFRPYHAHSSWFEMTLSLGVTGLVLWTLWFFETLLRTAIAVFTRRSAYLAAPVLIVYGLTSLTESVTLIWNELSWVMFTALAVKLALGDLPPQFAATTPLRASPARAG